MSRRHLKSLFYKVYIPISQKKYKRLKYIFQKGKKDTLAIIFSGFPGEDSAKYNYLNTLKSCAVHKLFILDDFGYKKRGSYYLGENGDWFVQKQVLELIEKIKEKYKVKHIVTIGSSKGGTAALYFGTKLHGDFCVMGAPQYYLGDYLSEEKHIPILEGIMGNHDQSSIDKLNKLMCECICSNKGKPEVYVHYSPKEHTYDEHIKDMIVELKRNGYCVNEDASYEYTNHGDVAKYFPKYLLKILMNRV